ncbi:hypothetical protein [Achromobacter xylosoxidans]|uniref:hypothetical protein n=1 Tax=Alcaligenes xylosoxydans xylosoxydans TaxID=85698 RepID=UPI002952973A|nr:hypothetical protein [Achromobacter xylosoxidans]
MTENLKNSASYKASQVGISGLRCDSYSVILSGFLIGGVEMYASKAAMLGIKPFPDSPTVVPKKEKSE